MGIASETIALIPIFLFLSKRLGYDRLFGFALLSVPMYLGWSAGVTNPFNVQIAQIIAELPIGSGMGFRFMIFGVYAIVGFYFLMKYGDKVKTSPSKSIMVGDAFNLDEFGTFEEQLLEKKHVYILVFFVLCYAGVLIAVQTID